MGIGVAEAVRVDVGDAGRSATASDRVGHAIGGHRAGQTEPEFRPSLVAVASPDTEVAIQRLRGLVPKRTRSLAPSLPQHERDVLLEIDVRHPQPGQLGEAHPGVEEQPNDRHIPAVVEPTALAGREQPPQLVVRVDGRWRLGDVRRSHRRHRVGLEFALGDRPAEERLQRSVPHRGRRGLESGQLVGDEVQAECLRDAVGSRRKPPAADVRLERRDRVEVGHQGLRTLVFGQKRPPPAVGEGTKSRSGGGARGLFGHFGVSENLSS